MEISIPNDGESWSAFARRLKDTQGEVLIVLPTWEALLPLWEEEEFHVFLDVCGDLTHRVQIATLKRLFVASARSRGIRVYDRVRDVRRLLDGHPKKEEVLRLLSPHVWRQQLRSRLQSVGLLSLPKLRIWILVIVSALLFLFVILRLLPSAEIRVWPRGDTISQTANIFLVSSGALVEIPQRVRTLDLIPRTAQVGRTITFDQISKDFMGQSSRVPMTVLNRSQEEYSLRQGSRLVNQAGMVFRLDEQVFLKPNDEVTVMATADDIDLYGEIIGERGNVPAGLRWDFSGLAKEEQALVYGENRSEATGGATAYTSVLKEKDLEIAVKQLKQELLAYANQMMDEELILFNAQDPDRMLERLYYDEFTLATYSGFVLPTQFLGEEVASIPVSGSIEFTAFAYNKKMALDMLLEELKMHVGEGRKLIDESVHEDLLVHHVIDYADDLSWIKLTVDLSGKVIYILDPLTPSGAHFAMNVRERVKGKSKEEARGIVKNLEEVDTVEVSLWPPWVRTLPNIPSHITVTPVE